MRHLTAISDLSDAHIESLLARAAEFALVPHRADSALTASSPCVQLLFYEDSTRTRTSFESAARRLGYATCLVTASGSSVAKGESLKDTILTLQASVRPQVTVLRHPENGAVAQVAHSPWCDTSMVNAGDGTNEHPTQALLDAATLRSHFGDIAGLKIAIVGDIVRSRVARSNSALLPRLGAHITYVAPRSLLPEDIDSWPGDVCHEIDDALPEVDVVMCLRIQRERMPAGVDVSSAEFTRALGLTTARAARMRAHAMVMHPGPMNRGVEIDSEVADSARSLIVEQVRQGLYTRMAVLESLVEAGR
ncbi:MAG: aspartate carbamoyltransferase catalytic subunit [Actinobacteria bacterium]|nr:aspartate carbamoyltransferase catalytic subunit [Actinomycetota bacterium]